MQLRSFDFPLAPLERLGLWVVSCDERFDGLAQLGDVFEIGPAQNLARHDAEPDLHLIEPTG